MNNTGSNASSGVDGARTAGETPKLRPKGWNALVALKREGKRLAKLAARKRRRGDRQFTGSTLSGAPAWMNRRTGKPHEHNRAKARRLKAQTDRSTGEATP